MVFEGVRPVLHVPFADTVEQPIIEPELAALATRMLDDGADGLVVLGLASEAWALTETERDSVVAIAAAACAGRASLVVGLDGTTAVARDRARRAVAAGADGLMLLPPRQAVGREALVRHFGAVAEAGGVPVLIGFAAGHRSRARRRHAHGGGAGPAARGGGEIGDPRRGPQGVRHPRRRP